MGISSGFPKWSRKRPFFARLFRGSPEAICSHRNFAGEEDEMSDEFLSRTRYGEAFWRAHHEAWRRSELNQREYCEAQGISLKAFGNWRAKFKAEPQPPARKLLYRRGGLSHTLGHSLSHGLSHMTYGSPASGPIVPPARQGHRRRFSAADKGQKIQTETLPAKSEAPAKLGRGRGFKACDICVRRIQKLLPDMSFRNGSNLKTILL